LDGTKAEIFFGKKGILDVLSGKNPQLMVIVAHGFPANQFAA
jgi:hypothetical protein